MTSSIVRLDDTTCSSLANWIGSDRQDHIGALNSAQFIENCSRAVAEPNALLPLFQHLPNHIHQEADEDVSKHPIGHLVPNGSERQVAPVNSKGRFGIGQLDVGPPELIRSPIVYVGAEQGAALAVLHPFIPLGARAESDPDRIVAKRRLRFRGKRRAEIAENATPRIAEPGHQGIRFGRTYDVKSALNI